LPTIVQPAAPYGYASSKSAYNAPDPEIVKYQLTMIQALYKEWGPTEFSTRSLWILRKNTEEGEVDILPTNSRFWNRRLVPFVHNRIQRDLDETIIVQKALRNIMLKPRQAGYTTWSIGMRLFLSAILNPGVGCMLMSQNSEYAAAHFDILKRFWRYFFVADPFDSGNQDNDWANSLRKNLLHVAYSNRRELIFDQLDSRVRCASAEVEESGQGLCVHPDTWIATADGKVVKFKQLRIGDWLIGSSGDPVEIVKRFRINARNHPFKGEARRIIVRGFQSLPIVCAPNHPFLTQRGMVEAKDIIAGEDYFAYPKSKLNEEFDAFTLTRKKRPSIFLRKKFDVELTRDFGLLCGWYLADGCGTHERCFWVKMANKRKMQYGLRRFLSAATILDMNPTWEKDNNIRLMNAPLIRWIKKHFGWTKTKRVPEWWRKAPKEFLWGLLEGWLVGDGWWDVPKSITGYGKNARLVMGMRDLAIALGIGAPLVRLFNKRTKKDIVCGVETMNRGRRYELWFVGPPYEQLARKFGLRLRENIHLRRKTQFQTETHVYIKVNSVTKTRCKRFLDVTVDSKDHLYCLPQVVTHNTIQHLVATEVSRWEGNPEETMANVKEAIPADGTLDIECTPNGAGGYFFEEWNRASNPGNKVREFTPHFHTWWWHEEYRRQPGVSVSEMTDEERDLVLENKLDGEQIQWRRVKKESLRHNFIEKYPEDPITCFLVMGNPFFETSTLNERFRELQSYEPAQVFNKLVIFKKAVKHRVYIIAADPAMGLPVTSENPDYSAAVVIDRETGEECAAYRAHVLPNTFGDDLVDLARMYNNAEIAVERLFEGGTVIEVITKQNMYGNIYWHRDWWRRDASNAKEVKEFPGFPTNARNRPMAVNRLKEFLSQCPDLIWDKTFIGEAMTFVYNEKGKPEAIKGAHDDTVMCRAIAYYVRAIRLGLFLPESVRRREKYGARPTESQEPEEQE
jgi:hypothetical protein